MCQFLTRLYRYHWWVNFETAFNWKNDWSKNKVNLPFLRNQEKLCELTMLRLCLKFLSWVSICFDYTFTIFHFYNFSLNCSREWFFLQFLKEFFNQNAEEENRPKKKAWEADGKTERTEDQTWKTGYGWICMQCSYGMWPVSKKAEKSCFLLLLSVNSKVKLV